MLYLCICSSAGHARTGQAPAILSFHDPSKQTCPPSALCPPFFSFSSNSNYVLIRVSTYIRSSPLGWRRIYSISQLCIAKALTGASQVVLVIKNLPANAGEVRDVGSIPGPGRSPGGGHGNPLQYSCLENPMDRGSLVSYSPWGCRVRQEWSNLALVKALTAFTTHKNIECASFSQ